MTPNIGWITDSFAGPDGPAFLYRTDDGGRQWRAVLSWDGPGAQQIRASADGNEALIVTAWGSRGTTLFHTSDGGAHWTAAGLPLGATSNSTVYFINPREGWVAADRDLVHTTDAGDHWTRMARLNSPSPYATFNDLPGMGFIDSSLGWFVPPYSIIGDAAPHLYLTHDGGATWGGQTLSRPGVLPATSTAFDAMIRFFDDQHGVVDVAYGPGAPCGSSPPLPPCRTDYVSSTSDGGAHWSAPIQIPSVKTVFIDATHWFGLTGDVMAVRRVVRTVDAGRNWSVLFAPSDLSNFLPNWDLGQAIGFIDPVHGWAISPDGTQLLFTGDGGVTWTARSLPR